jgi:AraC-like DNA-binding protein
MEQATRNSIVYRPQPGIMTEKMVFLLKLRGGLDKHLNKTNLNAELMAQEMEMSKSTLNRRLKSILNQGINDFIRQYRLQRAAEFLSAGYKVSEVSQRVGFKTPSYFTQCFKAYYQKTPSAFHKS